jgi:hypothetical protein
MEAVINHPPVILAMDWRESSVMDGKLTICATLHSKSIPVIPAIPAGMTGEQLPACFLQMKLHGKLIKLKRC